MRASDDARRLRLPLIIVAAMSLGCPREASVHVSTEEMARAQPDLERGRPGISLATTDGEEVRLDRARAGRWVGDDGARWSVIAPQSLSWLMIPPRGAAPKPETWPPRAGTWTFVVPDDSPLSTAGLVTTCVGGVATEIGLVAMLFTVGIAGPEPGFDFDKTIRVEGIATLASVGVATIGGVLWAIGNARFQRRKPDLGEGRFLHLTAPSRP